jgi:hypothetical protein
MQGQKTWKFLPNAESIAGARDPVQTLKSLILLNFSPWHTACCSTWQAALARRNSKVLPMLPALGAVSAALGVLKSLTTNASSSEPIGFSPAPANASGNSVPPAADATAASGVGSGAPISKETISALLKAQAQSLESDANSLLQDVSTTVSKDASVAYNAINQLLQRQTTTFQVPRGTLSINV